MKKKKLVRPTKLPPRHEVDAFLKDVESRKIEGSYGLPKNPSHSDRVKHSLCRDFVRYLQEHELTQRELATELKIDEARISEIVHYKIWLLSADTLIDLHSRIYPETTSIRFA